jgi:integrase
METQVLRTTTDGLHPKQPVTLNTYVNKWFRLKRGLKTNTKQNYQFMYDRFVRDSRIGTMRLTDLRKTDVVEFYTVLVDKGQLSVSTADTLQNVCRPAAELAVEEDIIRRNPFNGALTELRKEQRIKQADDRAKGVTKVESLTVAEQKRFLQYISGTQWEPIFGMFLLTGCRCGEITALQWEDIDTVNNVIHINKTLVYYEKASGRCGLEIHSTKTKAGTRDLPLNKQIMDLLDKQRQLIPADHKRVPVDGLNNFIFITKEGNPHRQDTLNRALRRIVRNANDEATDGETLLPIISTHKLRKSMCTNSVAAGVSVVVLGQLLGHSDPAVTMSVYAQARSDVLADADRGMVAGLVADGVLAGSNDENEKPRTN